MVIAVNYADKKFQRAQKLNSRSARQWGADKVIEYGPKDIDEAFRRHNEEILNAPRGADIIFGNHIYIERLMDYWGRMIIWFILIRVLYMSIK